LDQVQKQLKEYNAKTRFKKAGLVILAVNKLNKALSLNSMAKDDHQQKKIEDKQEMLEKINKS